MARVRERGQAVLEAVLLMVIFLAIVGAVATAFRQNELLAKIVRGPWNNLAGMFQNGVWDSPAKGHALHPNTQRRHMSVLGEEAR